MHVSSENSKYINDIKQLTYEAEKIIQEHQQLIELDVYLNLNRESLSAIRKNCYKVYNRNKDNKIRTLESVEFSKFEATNKLLKLGDFFISTSPYIINKYLLSEKKAIEELISELRFNRLKKVNNFLNLYPNISENILNELKFIIKDTNKDKLKYKDKDNIIYKYNPDYINTVPIFKLFQDCKDLNNKIDFDSID